MITTTAAIVTGGLRAPRTTRRRLLSRTDASAIAVCCGGTPQRTTLRFIHHGVAISAAFRSAPQGPLSVFVHLGVHQAGIVTSGLVPRGCRGPAASALRVHVDVVLLVNGGVHLVAGLGEGGVVPLLADRWGGGRGGG
jgi:hypothetical protein